MSAVRRLLLVAPLVAACATEARVVSQTPHGGDSTDEFGVVGGSFGNPRPARELEAPRLDSRSSSFQSARSVQPPASSPLKPVTLLPSPSLSGGKSFFEPEDKPADDGSSEDEVPLSRLQRKRSLSSIHSAASRPSALPIPASISPAPLPCAPEVIFNHSGAPLTNHS